MRIIRFVADDGRILHGKDHGDGTATVLIDQQGVLGHDEDGSVFQRLRGKSAIVADDDENMRQLVTAVLNKAGCACIQCADGAEAMKAMASEAPDLIISDIQMPHYNGYEIFAAARRLEPHPAVLLVTGYGYDPNHSLVRAASEGLEAVLYKPFTPDQLLQELGRAMAFSNGELWKNMMPTGERLPCARLLAPLVPSDIICIGRNYRDRSVEPAPAGPDDLEVFMKPRSSVLAPGHPIRLPELPGEDPRVEGEGELAVIIGTVAHAVAESDVMPHLLGYTIANDITARRWQTAGGGPVWMRGKGFDTFCPLGPAIVTADEIEDPSNLEIRTIVNGTTIRQGSTAMMIRSVARLVSDLSRHMTLNPGVMILTGAPPRVNPDQDAVLHPGDEIAVEIEGIGRLSNPVDAS